MTEEAGGSFWFRWKSYFIAQFGKGWTRVRGAVIPNTQTAVFATISWLLCRTLLDDPNPIFAPIVTFLCMGFSRNREPRKVIEIGLGASTGVLIGGLVGHHLGFGAWQLFAMLLVTPLIGRFIHRSDLVTFQTAINSIVVAGMMVISGAAGSGPLDRWLNALIGAGVALVGTAILPTNIVTRPRRYVAYTLGEASRILRLLGQRVADGDADAIGALRGRLISMRESLNDAIRALGSAQETAAISPVAIGSRAELAELDRMLELAERMHVTLSMMQRQARGMVWEVGPMPEIAALMWQTADRLEEVGVGVGSWQRPTQARDATIELAAALGPADVISDPGNWREATLMSLLRAIVIDLLGLTGLSLAQARSALADTGDYDPQADEDAATGVDLASDVWGTSAMPAVGLLADGEEATTESTDSNAAGQTTATGETPPDTSR